MLCSCGNRIPPARAELGYRVCLLCGEKSAKAVANQLLGKDEDFDTILRVRAIKSSLNGLELIVKNKYLFQNHKILFLIKLIHFQPFLNCYHVANYK